MVPTLVLQGGGPFVANDALDERMFGGGRVGHVVVLPTADAYEQPADLVAAAVAWGDRIGVPVSPLMVLTRADVTAEVLDTVAGARAVVLAGDSSSHLRSVAKASDLGTALGRMLRAGGTLVAVGACASAVCDPMVDSRGGGYSIGLGLVGGLAVVPESDRWPAGQLERARELATTTMVELPLGSALVWDGAWSQVGPMTVHGALPTVAWANG